MQKEKLLLDGKRSELEALFEKSFDPRKIEGIADVLWSFARDKFGTEAQGAMFLAFLNCVDRSMLHIVAKANANNPGFSIINPTQKKIVLPDS